MFKKKLEQLVKSRKYQKDIKEIQRQEGTQATEVEQTLGQPCLPMAKSVIELLTRSKYLLSVSGEKWTDRQKTRAKILFRCSQR